MCSRFRKASHTIAHFRPEQSLHTGYQQHERPERTHGHSRSPPIDAATPESALIIQSLFDSQMLLRITWLVDLAQTIIFPEEEPMHANLNIEVRGVVMRIIAVVRGGDMAMRAKHKHRLLDASRVPDDAWSQVALALATRTKYPFHVYIDANGQKSCVCPSLL